MPGYAGRNWDYGVLIHGRFSCPDTLSYQATVNTGCQGRLGLALMIYWEECGVVLRSLHAIMQGTGHE